MSRRISLAVVVVLLCSVAADAQYWPLPAKTPGVDVTCTGCLGASAGKLTPGYPSTITTFTGRFLDSQATTDLQYRFRTARAFLAVPAPSRNRVYMIIGSALAAYSLDTFFTRAAAGRLDNANSVPITGVANLHPSPVDEFLSFDSFFYAENEPNGWTFSMVDGQDRLYDLDYDDTGSVYLAYSVYGWGIVKDDGASAGTYSLMASQFQDPATSSDSVTPVQIAALKGSNGHYYAIIGGANAQPIVNVWDVTNKTAPTKQSSALTTMAAHAKTTAADRVGIVTSNGTLQIWTTDALVSGGRPIVEFSGASGTFLKTVASDGVNFFTASDVSTGLVISVYTPNGATYKRQDYPTAVSGQSQDLRYGDGYLTWSGYTGGASNLRVFKVQNLVPTEIDFTNAHAWASDYFQRYYTLGAGVGYTRPAQYMQMWHAGATIKKNNKTYLFVTAYGLGDVYELPSTDSVSVTSNGTQGTVNGKVPAGSTGPFYGDPVGFTATTLSPAGMNVNWDFGDGTPLTPSSIVAAPGGGSVSVRHQFAGAQGASVTRNVTASNALDSSINSTASVTISKPTIRFGVGNYKYLFLQPNASSPAPIVAGDTFFDASDGTIESHYDTWTIDGTPSNLTPLGAPAAGVCGTHSLSFVPQYGQYTAPGAPVGTPAAYSIAPFTYSVRPFAAYIDPPTSSAGNLIFNAFVRTSADTTAISASQAATLTFNASIVNSAGAVVTAFTPVSGNVGGNGAISFSVPSAVFNGARDYRAHVVVTSPNGVGASCAGMTTADAFSDKLNAPDPNPIIKSCTGTNGAPPCTFSVTSASGADTSAWNFAWSVSPTSNVSPPSGNTATFAPTFTSISSPQTFTVSVVVSNAISTLPQLTTQVVVPASTCPPMQKDTDLFISASSCTSPSQGTGCSNPVTLTVSTFAGYNFSCATHHFTWNFGDGQTASTTAPTVQHTFPSASPYTVNVHIDNGTQTVDLTPLTVTFGGGPPPPPPPPPPPGPTPGPSGCPTMIASGASQNVFIYYTGSASGCNTYSGNCSTSDTINFAAQGFNYDFACGAHQFQWNFGDGTTGTGQSPAHKYNAQGSYPVTLTITNVAQPSGVQVAAQIVVGTGSPTPGPTPGPPPPSGGCSPVIAGQTFFVTYSGPQSGCTAYNTDSTPCSTAETIPFTADKFNYDYSCATHTFSWDFGDGQTATGQLTSHRYVNAGAYNLKLQIGVNGQNYLVTQTVKVGSNAGGSPGVFAYDFTVQPIGGVPHGYIFTAFVVGSGASAATSYNWDFGDGHTCNACGATEAHVYADAKTYTVTLTVPGQNGNAQHPSVPTATRHRGVHH